MGHKGRGQIRSMVQGNSGHLRCQRSRRKPVALRVVAAPTKNELHALLQTLITRLKKLLMRQGMLLVVG